MCSFLCNSKVIFETRGLLNLKFNGRDSTANTKPSLFFRNKSRPISISCSTNVSTDQNENFTVSYLIHSCGLSEEKAVSVSKKIQLKTPSKPDSVLTLLRDYDFTDTHISKCVLSAPSILLSDLNKTLKPKLDFFRSIGLGGTELAEVLSKNPCLLNRNLENHIIPSIGFLKTLVHTHANVVKMLKRTSWVLTVNAEKFIIPNIALLQTQGVSDSNISALLTSSPGMLLLSTDKFNELVTRLKETGFDPLKATFISALRAFISMKESTFEGKAEVYRRWGWSEDDLRIAFLKQPLCMTVSENKIMQIMNVLVTKMGYEPSLIAHYPNVLSLSLEKRIVPRSLVLKVLTTEGLVSNNQSIGTVFLSSENYFLKAFVTKFENQVPQLLNIYLGKVNVLELTIWYGVRKRN